jgi:hypothetical protein
MFYALSSKENEWKNKLNLFVALAPVTRTDHTKSDFFKYMAKTLPVTQFALDTIHMYHILDGI